MIVQLKIKAQWILRTSGCFEGGMTPRHFDEYWVITSRTWMTSIIRIMEKYDMSPQSAYVIQTRDLSTWLDICTSLDLCRHSGCERFKLPNVNQVILHQASRTYSVLLCTFLKVSFPSGNPAILLADSHSSWSWGLLIVFLSSKCSSPWKPSNSPSLTKSHRIE